MDDARERILSSAKEIFLEQGYRKTTIRQIVGRSGLLIGAFTIFSRTKKIFSGSCSWMYLTGATRFLCGGLGILPARRSGWR